MTNSRIAMQICTNNMMIWRHEIKKKIRKELNNYELSRTKDLIQENSKNSIKSTKLPKFSRTQTRLLKDSRIKTNQFPNDQGFSSMYSAKTKQKWFFLFFFFLRQQSRFQDQASFSFLLFFYIYYIFRQEQNKIKNLGLYANFDQESIKRTLTYD